MKLSDFSFDLPPQLIADTPASPRDSARLLELLPDDIRDYTIKDLVSLLRPNDIMVFNNTKVIPARLLGKRGEAQVEVTLHKQINNNTWNAFARPAKRLRLDDIYHIADDFSARVSAKGDNGEVTLAFNKEAGALFAALSRYGHPPLPPYISRKSGFRPEDKECYQTIYAKHEGAVAAPTAGLHFTEALFAALETKGIEKAFVTLHVGAGTFLPVKVENISEHVMHREWCCVDKETADRINQARERGGRVVAVGTTSLRVLESAADSEGVLHPYTGETDIFITPGYRFRMVDVLMTNFHLPCSTLFMLVCAFAGVERMKAAYTHAIASGYRFYSYGDANLLYLDPQ